MTCMSWSNVVGGFPDVKTFTSLLAPSFSLLILDSSIAIASASRHPFCTTLLSIASRNWSTDVDLSKEFTPLVSAAVLMRHAMASLTTFVTLSQASSIILSVYICLLLINCLPDTVPDNPAIYNVGLANTTGYGFSVMKNTFLSSRKHLYLSVSN